MLNPCFFQFAFQVLKLKTCENHVNPPPVFVAAGIPAVSSFNRDRVTQRLRNFRFAGAILGAVCKGPGPAEVWAQHVGDSMVYHYGVILYAWYNMMV